MIKRLWFSPARHGDDPPWRRSLRAPEESRPVRVTESITLMELAPDAPWAQLGTAWFHDPEHLDRFDAWGGAASDASMVVEEIVLRGADWLEQRWAAGGVRFKQVALARRAAGLSGAEFSRRWRSHAGSVGATPIPDAARGQAYAQGHPLPGDRPYDAVSEAWFDDLDGLRARVAWMAGALVTAQPDDLFGERHLFAVREDLLR